MYVCAWLFYTALAAVQLFMSIRILFAPWREVCARILPFTSLLRDMIKVLFVKEHCNTRQIMILTWY